MVSTFSWEKIEDEEYQVVVLKNERKETKLGAFKIQNDKASSISNAISFFQEEFSLWNLINMIIADTIAANTCPKGGVVLLLN